MRAIKPNIVTGPRGVPCCWRLLAIVLGGAGTVAALAWLKVIDPAKLAFWRSKENIIPADWIAIPMCCPADPGVHGGHPGLLDESEDRPMGPCSRAAGKRFRKGSSPTCRRFSAG